jgi:hypothetical protein
MAAYTNVQIPRDELKAICSLLRHATREVIQVGSELANMEAGNSLTRVSVVLYEQIKNLEAFADK